MSTGPTSHRSADVDDHAADPTQASIPAQLRRPDRPPSRAERRAEAAHMVTLLAAALATQVGRLVASADPAPEGWWFHP